MVSTWPGDMDSYLRYCRDENAAERREQRRDQEARETFCAHGRNLMQRCIPCEQEVGDRK